MWDVGACGGAELTGRMIMNWYTLSNGTCGMLVHRRRVMGQGGGFLYRMVVGVGCCTR